jgi:20S proteasome alpha/beta subunit
MLVEGCTCGLHGRALAMTHEARKRLDGCTLSQKPPRLPYRPRKPYIPEVKRGHKAMTIGIGFNCDNGIVLGADSQMTRQNINKFHGQKLFCDFRDGRILALASADDLSLAIEVWEKLLKHDLASGDAVQTALEEILDNMGRMYSELPIQLLVGIATKDEAQLFTFIGKGIHTQPTFAVIGVGDSSLIRYLADKVPVGFWSPNECAVAAAYILKQAEEYIDMCDGPMDLVILLKGPRLINFGSAKIDEIGADLAQQELSCFMKLFRTSLPLPT